MLRKILLAQPRGFCAGVDRAIKIVDLALERYGAPLYVRKEIVHNRHVVESFQRRGVIFVDELQEVPADATVIFSAHGVSPAVPAEAEARGLTAIDATCPLVNKVHAEVLRYVGRGYHILLIGHRGHDEVVGTMGHAPKSITLITNGDDALNAQVPVADKLMVLCQTTLSVDETAETLAALRRRFPNLETPGADDICYATQNRQNGVKALSKTCQGVLIVGSANSSNAARLVDVAESRGVKALLIDRVEDLPADQMNVWLDGIETLGISSGASTPEKLVEELLDKLIRDHSPEVALATTVEEDVVFSLPPQLSLRPSPRQGKSPETK
jgi:4-hydroxy-3-methylbut-2-en-1-yl diphosphate reductase